MPPNGTPEERRSKIIQKQLDRNNISPENNDYLIR